MKSFLDRKHENPDVEIEAWITGVKHGSTGMMDWSVTVVGENEHVITAGISDGAAEVLRER